MIQLFGIKTSALLDYWTIIHVLSGIILGFIIIKISNKYKIKNRLNFLIISLLLIAYTWEIIELFAELGIYGLPIQQWFYGIELPLNRLIIDPLSLLIGGLIISKNNNYKIFLFATIISLTWLLTHIFLFRTAVYF